MEIFITNFSTAGLAACGHTRPVRMITVANGFWSEAETMEGASFLARRLLSSAECRSTEQIAAGD
jgi:hypothetical protein